MKPFEGHDAWTRSRIKHRKYNCKRYRAEHSRVVRELLQSIKADTPCADCGKRFPHYMMEFDHVNGDKEYKVSSMTSMSWTSIYKELGKCEVVCRNHHGERTWRRQHANVRTR